MIPFYAVRYRNTLVFADHWNLLCNVAGWERRLHHSWFTRVGGLVLRYPL